jgi:phosphoacetylglucosamine mutase
MLLSLAPMLTKYIAMCICSTTPRVLIGRDTRPSSPLLAELALAGARILGADASDLGVLTTPQLHHCVRMINGEQGSGQCWGDEEWIGEDGYYEKLAAGLVDLLGTEADAATSSRRGWFGLGKDVTPLVVDGACGVGAEKIAPMVAKITSSEVLFKCEVRNGVGEGALNEGCGAEFVQKGRIPPANFSPEGLKEVRCCRLVAGASYR